MYRIPSPTEIATSDSGWAVPPPPDATPLPVRSVDAGFLPEVPGYRIACRLGRGGMGEVFEAVDLRLGRRVGLKLLAAGRSDDPEWLARFQTEAAAFARLQHPNVVQIHDAGETDGRPFLALEFVAGGNLADRLRHGPLPPREAAVLARDLAGAAAAIHAAGVVHRDLKPANVLMSLGPLASVCDQNAADGRGPTEERRKAIPKISDFGLAHLLGSDHALTQTGAMLGTPSYMAPEQVADGRNIGPGADLYALGAILYECLTGRPPFPRPRCWKRWIWFAGPSRFHPAGSSPACHVT